MNKVDLKIYLRTYLPKWRERRRQEARRLLGGKCVRCGSTRKLEFDHIDPKTKVLPIGRLWMVSKAIFYAELEKCQLLCKSCHLQKSKENEELKTKADHGGWTMTFVRGCTCDLCNTRRDRRNESRRLARQK